MNGSIARNPAEKSKSELRRMLLEARLHAALDPLHNDALRHRMLATLQRYAPRSVGFYWPLAGEFDARGAIALWLADDANRQASLPVVKGRAEPLEFHAWTPDAPMQPGPHRIPVPACAQIVQPELLFVPCVGFDEDGYRLGYGGGYYDRTLAAWRGSARPVTVGVAYEACRTPRLVREAHDIPLDAIITDAACYPHQTS